jgi:hypothetical protein
MEFLKKHWFQISILILLALCFLKLGQIHSVNSPYLPAYDSDTLLEIRDSSLQSEYYLEAILSELEDVDSSVNNVWYSVQDLE